MPNIIFFSIALSACIFAFLAVISRNIFHCAVWLAMTLLSISGIYFALDAGFLGVIQILVYVGGIITLFVFAIKLTAKISDASIRQTNEQVWPSAAVALLLFFFLAQIISSHPWMPIQPEGIVISLKDLGRSLLTGYVLPFEYISLLLLAAMVGAIVIGRVKK